MTYEFYPFFTWLKWPSITSPNGFVVNTLELLTLSSTYIHMTSSEAILSQHILWGCRGQEAASLVVMLAFHVTLSTKGWYSIKLYIFLVTVSVRSTLLFIWRNFFTCWIFVKMGWIILVLPSFCRIFNFPKVPRRQQKSGTAPTGTGTTTSGKI